MKAVRFVGAKGSGASRYRDALTDERTVVIDSYSAKANVTLGFRLDGKALEIKPPPDARDLLDLAVAVYVADEMHPRESGQDGWSRRFEFLVPVRHPTAWEGAEEHLSQALGILSGDDFTFRWCSRRALGAIGNHRTRLPKKFDTVCLFSGGVDSLLGAVGLLEEGRRVLLVGHQAGGATASAQTALAEGLRNRYPGRVSLVQCRAARRLSDAVSFPLPEKCEDTHRTRSFLFLSLAVAVARAAGIEDVFIAENGLIALNPPLQVSRLGTATTRTAHPRYLIQLHSFFESLGVFEGTVRNPFLYQSKTEMVRDAASALYPLLARSVSCTRPTRYQNMGVRHCGYCVPCIYRRAAFLEASIDAAGDYGFDVFGDLTNLSSHKQAEFRVLVRFARRVVGATRAQLEAIVVSNGVFDPVAAGELGPAATSGYEPWAEMLSRWAGDFLDKVGKLSSQSTLAVLGPDTSGKAAM